MATFGVVAGEIAGTVLGAAFTLVIPVVLPVIMEVVQWAEEKKCRKHHGGRHGCRRWRRHEAYLKMWAKADKKKERNVRHLHHLELENIADKGARFMRKRELDAEELAMHNAHVERRLNAKARYDARDLAAFEKQEKIRAEWKELHKHLEKHHHQRAKALQRLRVALRDDRLRQQEHAGR